MFVILSVTLIAHEYLNFIYLHSDDMNSSIESSHFMHLGDDLARSSDPSESFISGLQRPISDHLLKKMNIVNACKLYWVLKFDVLRIIKYCVAI